MPYRFFFCFVGADGGSDVWVLSQFSMIFVVFGKQISRRVAKGSISLSFQQQQTCASTFCKMSRNRFRQKNNAQTFCKKPRKRCISNFPPQPTIVSPTANGRTTRIHYFYCRCCHAFLRRLARFVSKLRLAIVDGAMSSPRAQPSNNTDDGARALTSAEAVADAAVGGHDSLRMFRVSSDAVFE